MKRYFFEIEYKGKNFFGWQKQPDECSVQETIEESLMKLNSNKSVTIVGCGRTDTGVHAKQYYFHADLNIENQEDWKYKLNTMLPDSIVVKSIFNVDSSIHARYGALKRTYRYYVHFNKSAFSNDLSLFLKYKLDFDSMNDCAKLLIGKKDFSSFARSNTDVKHHICDVTSAKWIFVNDNEAYFEISANRFLRNMVRAIVGTLLEVGAGKLDNYKFQSIINAQERSKASTSAPAHGLFLWSVEYPFQ